MKKLTHRQFASYLKKNGETMATLTDNFHDFRAGDSLFFQFIPNSYISIRIESCFRQEIVSGLSLGVTYIEDIF
jgi:hypothetical protein